MEIPGMALSPLYLDGEKIPASELRHIFRLPPNISSISRSALLVGSRGAGKTTLLVYLSSLEPQNAVYLSLIDCLGPLTKNTPAGIRSTEQASAEAIRQRSAATCYLAFNLLMAIRERGQMPPLDRIADLLPPFIRPSTLRSWDEWFTEIGNRLQNIHLSDEEAHRINAGTPFRNVVRETARYFAERGLQLKLFFDKADAVPPPAVVPVLELLDQEGPHLTLVATRPAPHSDMDWGSEVDLIPDDQYDVIPLGNAPRDPDWQDFVREAISAQIPTLDKGGPLVRDALGPIVWHATDSVRLALQLSNAVARGSGSGWEKRLLPALEAAQTKMLNRAEARLKHWHADFKRIQRHWRKRALGVTASSTLRAPVLFELKSREPESYLEGFRLPQTPLDHFLAACIQDGLLRPRHGDYWVPGKRFREIEAAPLVLWDRVDGVLREVSTLPIPVKLPAAEFLGGGTWTGTKRGSIFVALRFDFERSWKFCKDLEAALAKHPMLLGIRLRHGQLPAGAKWAREIRALIRECGLGAIGDVSGVRGDVLFELGMAYGLDRAIIPVVESEGQIPDCPFWLTAFNVGAYDSPENNRALIAGILKHVYGPRYGRRERLPLPAPFVCGCIGIYDWNLHQVEQLEHMATREAMVVEKVPEVTPDNYEFAWELVARSSLLTLALDGTRRDSFAHFACGVAAARPSTGSGSKIFARRVLLLTENRSVAIPPSILRCSGLIEVAQTKEGFVHKVREFLEQHAKWRRSGGDG